MKRITSGLAFWIIVAGAVGFTASAATVTEVKPGVFFRVTDQGCNNGWIIFQDYVLVIDSNIPNEAVRVIEDIHKTTDKPIRFVFDTHHHWDHSYGNALFVREGATVVAQRLCAEKLKTMDAEFTGFMESNDANKPFKDLGLAHASLVFDDRMVFDDGTRRVELLYYGHGHTAGDAVAYLPKEKILFTGDSCVNGAFNYFGDAYSEKWIELLEEFEGLDVETICPGHGEKAGRNLLKTQKEYFLQLREQVQKGVDAGMSLEAIQQSIDIPLYKKWTGIDPPKDHAEHIYKEMTGLIIPWQLAELNLVEGPSPTRDTPGWTPPRKIVTRTTDEKELTALKRVAPHVEIVSVRSNREMLQAIADADGAEEPIPREIFASAKKLRWVHSRSAGVEDVLFPDFVQSDVILTNGKATHGATIADHVLGFMLLFSKGLAAQYREQLQGRWRHVSLPPQQTLEGQTLLILGLGGIGRETARRAAGFGMKILAVDYNRGDKPHYVTYIGLPDELHGLLPRADFVLSTVPLTTQTFRYFDKDCFAKMKPSAYFINVGRGQTVNQEDLVEALKNQRIAGAALDVTDPEPLPPDHPLWTMDNVIITPHMSGRTVQTALLRKLLFRENVRRFAHGEPLLNVVDKVKGY